MPIKEPSGWQSPKRLRLGSRMNPKLDGLIRFKAVCILGQKSKQNICHSVHLPMFRPVFFCFKWLALAVCPGPCTQVLCINRTKKVSRQLATVCQKQVIDDSFKSFRQLQIIWATTGWHGKKCRLCGVAWHNLPRNLHFRPLASAFQNGTVNAGMFKDAYYRMFVNCTIST